jgi:hypothetical protein
LSALQSHITAVEQGCILSVFIVFRSEPRSDLGMKRLEL